VSTQLQATHGSIDVGMMARFRNGLYGSQDAGTKAAWIVFATKLMATVNPAWKPADCVRNQLLSAKTTTSDEAFVMWVLAHYVGRWDEDHVEDIAREVAQEPAKKRYKRAGASISKTNLADFYATKKKIKVKRREEYNQNGWEQAVQAEANAVVTARVRNRIGGLPSTSDESEEPVSTQDKLTRALPEGITWDDLQIEV
jgi:hypothetical protein